MGSYRGVLIQPKNVFTMDKHIKMGTVFLMIAIRALVWMEIVNVLKYFVFHLPLIIHVFTKEKHIKMESVSKLDAIHAGAEEERLEDVSKNFVEDVIQTLIAQLAIIDHFHSADQNLQIKLPF